MKLLIFVRLVTLAILVGLTLVAQVVTVVIVLRLCRIFEIEEVVLKGLIWKILMIIQQCFGMSNVQSL